MTRIIRLQATVALAALLAASAAVPASAEVTAFEIDKSHSSIQFKIRHLLSKTTGKFGRFTGSVALDPDKRDAVTVSANIEAASIDTDDTKRDDHLRGADFFDVAKFPTLAFEGGELVEVNADRTKGKLKGKLTMHGVTRDVVLDVAWYGTVVDPWGNRKAAFSGTTTLNRKDYGIIWNKALDSGGYVIGDEVEVEIEIEAQVPKAAH